MVTGTRDHITVDQFEQLIAQPEYAERLFEYVGGKVVVWIVEPGTQTVEVYAPGAPVRVLTTNDTLDGGDALPGLQIAVRDIFSAQEDE